MCGNWIGPGSTIQCLLSAGGRSRGVRWAAGTRGSPWPAAYVGGARGCPVPAWPRRSAASGVARLALAEADPWMILCLHIRSGQQPSPTTLHACPRLEGRPRARHGAGRCSASRASSPGAHVIWRRPVRLDAGKQRPERRSTDGQTILKAASEGWKLGSDLRKLVELRGFEPRTSCMPCSLCWIPDSALGSRCQGGWWR